MFPNRLRTLRNDRSWTQADLASKINVSPKTIGAWERGTREPPIETITKLSDIFDVSADYLLGKTTQKNTISTTETDDILTMYKIDTRGLTEDEIDDMREELEEYNDFMTKRLQEKIAKKKRK